MNILELIENHYRRLKESDFKGFDLYDGLESRIFKKSPFFKSRLFRLAWIQLFKRSPVNFRSLFLVPGGYNAKGLAMFIKGLVNLYKLKKEREYLREAYRLADIIISQRAKNRDYFCVGYNFFWEAKAFSVPAFTPNMIVSSFVAQAFLDLYDIDKDKKWLNYSLEIGRFIDKELKLFESDETIVFGYIPGEDTIVHNVNLMGSRLFARLYSYTKEEKYREYATKSAQYSINSQREDGAWVYGKSHYLQWVDNFHTGFNLVALNDVQRYLSIKQWQERIDLGLKYHFKHHFLEDMTPKYYVSKLYPIDIHNFAQGIDTFISLGYRDNARKLLEKSIDLMWDSNKHYFYYQKRGFYTNKINYIRWGQAWMFYAMTEYRIKKGKQIWEN